MRKDIIRKMKLAAETLKSVQESVNELAVEALQKVPDENADKAKLQKLLADLKTGKITPDRAKEINDEILKKYGA